MERACTQGRLDETHRRDDIDDAELIFPPARPGCSGALALYNRLDPQFFDFFCHEGFAV
jgi:hypothetical protein